MDASGSIGRWAWAAVPLLAAVAGCGPGRSGDGDAETDATADAAEDVGTEDAPVEVPPRICKGRADLSDPPFFVERADEVALGPASIHVLGNRMMSADLDGDLHPDLIVHRTGSNRRDDPLEDGYEERRRWVLMNRPSGAGRVFEDATVESRYGLIRGEDGGLGRSAQLAVAADVDNDGDLDLFSGTYVDASSGADPPDPGDRSEILLNDGDGRFTLAPLSDVHAPDPLTTTSASFLDYDRDGIVDVYVGNFREVSSYRPAWPDTLYRGHGDGTFEDVTDRAGLALSRTDFGEDGNKPTYGVTTCDIDGDGDTDLLQSSYARQFNMLWLNEGDGTFTEVGRATGYAADGGEDYTDNEFYRCHCRLTGTCTAPDPIIGCDADYWQSGVDDQPWRLGGNTFTTVCGDLDNDGDNDVLHTEIRHWHIGSSSDPTQILENMPSASTPGFRLERVDNQESGLHRGWPPHDWNEGDLSAAFLDFDNDGLLDIILACSDYPDTRAFFWQQQPDGTFVEIAVMAGLDLDSAQEVTAADYDRDGDVDIVMGFSTARLSSWDPRPAWDEPRLFFFENVVGQDGDAIEIQLRGDPDAGTNAAAVGARVQVTAGGVTQTREVGGGYGHFGLQTDLVLHFGVAGSCVVDEIRVAWPDAAGTEEVFTDVHANYLVRIDQGAPRPEYLMALPP
jgi:hypothetical protein